VDLLYFVLLVSVLIFIHEFGHFAFAKLFGVKVLTFSLGFGPRLLRIRGKETEYCVAVIPLGGFVKMLESSKQLDEILPEDRRRTFEAQALWKRVVIVLAGPAMNVLFPVLLYTAVFSQETTLTPPTVGVVLPGKPADGKLVPGDRILSVDGRDVVGFPDVQRIVARSAGRALRLVVDRDGKSVEVTVTPAEETEARPLDIVEKVGRIGFAPSFPAPVIGVPRTDSPAWRAGLRTFDRVVAVNGKKVERFVDLTSLLAASKGDALVVTYLRPTSSPNALGGLGDVAVLDAGLATLTPLPRASGAAAPQDANARADDARERAGIESADLYVAYVPEGASEWRAGLRAGDRITHLDGVPQRHWATMEDALVRGASTAHALQWTRAGEPMAGSFQVRRESWDDELGQHYDRYVFRTSHWLPDAPDDVVPNPHRILSAVRRGVEETASVCRFIAIGLVRLFQGRVSLSSVSGPITIYDIAGQAGARGTTHFVWAMALVSVNLGLLNLLPIPVLDGGHLLFLAMEGISRRPVSIRVREVASLFGMSVLVLLMLVAFKNDVTRHWDLIVRQVRDVVGGT